MKAKSIKELVEFALADNANKSAVFTFSKLPKSQAQILEKFIHVDLTGSERIIDTSGIRHALRKHGNAKHESNRGQVALTIDDFELLPKVMSSPDKIRYDGKNNLNQDVFLYEKRIGALYVVVEAVRFSKKGNRLVFHSMRKKK